MLWAVVKRAVVKRVPGPAAQRLRKMLRKMLRLRTMPLLRTKRRISVLAVRKSSQLVVRNRNRGRSDESPLFY
jgi:hypothetical protein